MKINNHRMETFTANTAKQKLGHVLDTARTEPVAISRHGKSAFVVTTKEDYDELVRMKFERLKSEVQRGFTQLDRGEVSDRSFADIATQALDEHRKENDLS